VTAPELNRLVRLYSWARLALAQLLLVMAPLLPAELLPASSPGIVALALLAVVASSGVLLLVAPLAQPLRVSWLLCLLDVVLVTAVVAATGGPRSIYSFLYVLGITAACVLLPRAGALAMAAAGSGLYTGLVFVRTIFPMTAFLEPPHETTALEVLTMFLNSATLLVVAIVAGGLADQYRATRHELETQRKDLRELQAFKEVVLRSAGSGLIALDRDHAITALNRAAEAITGRTASEVIGRPWAELFGASLSIDSVEAEIAAHPTTSTRHETTLGRADGRQVPVRLTFTALRSGEGSRLGLVGVCEDLTEIREMEGRFRQADRLATLGRMATNIAHEIRNPLASLSGAVEALTGGGASGEERERLNQIVARESDRLNGIIGNFLEYARPAPLTIGSVDVADALEEVLLLLQHRELPPGLKIVREFPPRLDWRADTQQLREALWNLCLNAVEAMPAGGELRVATEVGEGKLRISVGDTGEGIPADDLPHIFEPFFSTKAGGNGLGLALVHRIAGDHGGDVDVRTAPGLGTRFVLTLPGGSHA
jgi:two-component system sensor histidine kinase PilS (NtrC family)